MAFPILIIVILIILIVWWALLRNARKYTPDFPVHEHEEEHATARGAETYAAESAAARSIGVEPQPVVEEAPKAEVPPSAADTSAMQAAAPTDQPLVSDATMHTEPPETPIVTPPADQPYATDYGSPSEGSGERPSGEAMMNRPAGDEMVAPQVFDTPSRSAAAAVPDDLALLEGIGPRVKEVLAESGIHTFADLAATEVNKLREILEAVNLRFIDPGTWPEQAKLAAEGRMEELNTLMGSLRGGRRVTDD